jgi:hypothetical protein
MELFFKPLQLGVTDANDPVQFVDLGLRRLFGFVYFAAVSKRFGQSGLGSISPLLNLRWINLIL